MHVLPTGSQKKPCGSRNKQEDCRTILYQKMKQNTIKYLDIGEGLLSVNSTPTWRPLFWPHVRAVHERRGNGIAARILFFEWFEYRGFARRQCGFHTRCYFPDSVSHKLCSPEEGWSVDDNSVRSRSDPIANLATINVGKNPFTEKKTFTRWIVTY